LFSSKTKRLFVLENTILNAPAEDTKEKVMNEHQCYVDDDEQVVCVMLANISHELQRLHENIDFHTMIMHLKE